MTVMEAVRMLQSLPWYKNWLVTVINAFFNALKLWPVWGFIIVVIIIMYVVSLKNG